MQENSAYQRPTHPIPRENDLALDHYRRGHQNSASPIYGDRVVNSQLPHPLTIDDLAIPDEARTVFGHLIDKLRGKRLPRPTGWHVLCLQYVRDETTTRASGVKLYLPEQARNEDRYQGRCGLVLALGPDAYADTAKFASGPWCAPGDVVSWRNLESAASRIQYGDVVLARLADDTIVDVGIDPTLVV